MTSTYRAANPKSRIVSILKLVRNGCSTKHEAQHVAASSQAVAA